VRERRILADLSLRRDVARPDAVVVPERAPAFGDNLSGEQPPI
jgi:hypothetical protein